MAESCGSVLFTISGVLVDDGVFAARLSDSGGMRTCWACFGFRVRNGGGYCCGPQPKVTQF